MVHEQGPPPVRANTQLILLVEDETDIVEFLVLAISQATPHRVKAVHGGVEALDIAKEIKPHLLILDYMLPGMNGLELYDRLRSMEEGADTPAIMISANLPTKELQKRKIIGIPKPFGLDELLNTIEMLLA